MGSGTTLYAGDTEPRRRETLRFNLRKGRSLAQSPPVRERPVCVPRHQDQRPIHHLLSNSMCSPLGWHGEKTARLRICDRDIAAIPRPRSLPRQERDMRLRPQAYSGYAAVLEWQACRRSDQNSGIATALQGARIRSESAF